MENRGAASQPSIVEWADGGRAHDARFGIELSNQDVWWVVLTNEKRLFPFHDRIITVDLDNPTNNKLQVNACVNNITSNKNALLKR